MKRLAVLMIACLALTLGGVEGVFGQKKKMDKDVIPEIAEIPKLVKHLKDSDPKVRAEACHGLGLRGEIRARDVADAIAPIADLLKSDPDAGVRREAAYSLGLISSDSKNSVEALMKCMENDKEDLKVKTAAAASLGNFGADAKPALPLLREAIALGKAAGKDKDKKLEAEYGKAAGQSAKRIGG
jgi:HEAT repeat protein